MTFAFNKDSMNAAMAAFDGKTIINLTPHPINVHGCDVFTAPVKGMPLPRVDNTYTVDVDGFTVIGWGDVANLPDQVDGTFVIVSGFVAQAAPHRKDLVVPASNHPLVVRTTQADVDAGKARQVGHIVSVPFLARSV